jgi:hypothetical protein
VEKLQLRPTFPGKPLIKTYVALWESCRSIVSLQLSFLEIFDLVVTFASYAILKPGKWNKTRPGDVVTALWCTRVRSSCVGHVAGSHCSGVRTHGSLRCGPARASTAPRLPPRYAPRPGRREVWPRAQRRHAPRARGLARMHASSRPRGPLGSLAPCQVGSCAIACSRRAVFLAARAAARHIPEQARPHRSRATRTALPLP